MAEMFVFYFLLQIAHDHLPSACPVPGMNSHRKHKIGKKVVRVKRLWRIGFAVKRSEATRTATKYAETHRWT